MKFKFPPIEHGEVDVGLWFLEKGRRMVRLAVNFKLDLLAGAVEPETLERALALFNNLTRLWSTPYREALKEAGLTNSLRPRVASKQPATSGPRKRARNADASNDVQVAMQDLAEDPNFSKYVYKYFKKDGLPKYLQIAASNPAADVDPLYSENIKTSGLELATTLATIVESHIVKDWPDATIQDLIEIVWSLARAEMAKEPNFSRIDSIFSWMNKRLQSWEEPSKYHMIKGQKRHGRKNLVQAGHTTMGGVSSSVGPIDLDGGVVILEAS